jgi:hypothetical protein
LRVVDLRRPPNQPLPDLPDAVWYAEGIRIGAADHPVAYAPRVQIERSRRGRPLILYSVPPSAAVLRWLLDTVQPFEVVLGGRVTTEDTLDAVLRQVAGMCKFALQRDSILHIDRMAARLGTTEAVIRYSLLWLQSRGQIAMVEWPTGDLVHIHRGPAEGTPAAGTPAPNGQGSTDEAALIQAQLEEQLAEIRAYRRYFMRAAVRDLGLPVG